MVSDAESTTERKRAERLQQNTRVRSRSTAVTHSIEGSIHSSERIKFQKKRGRGAPKTSIDSTENITAMRVEQRERRFRLVAVRPQGYARLSRLRPPWVDLCQPTDLRLLRPAPSASFAQTLLVDIQGRVGSAAAAALFVFSERSLKHSRTLACDYHVLQKCDKAQQLRTLAPPPLASFSFFPPNIQSLFRVCSALRLTLSGISRWIPLSKLAVELGAGGALLLSGDFEYKRI